MSRARPPLAASALVLNAFIWGCSWWPLRHLEQQGLHPLWATAAVFAVACLVILAARPRAGLLLVRTPSLWMLLGAAGTTNACFNWGVVTGDVVRVVLLFYLMPLWAVLLGRVVLGERLGASAFVRIGLSLTGAAIVLWPAASPALAWSPLADALGVIGGFTFALNNVLLRRFAAQPQEGRALAMFTGGVVVSGGLALTLAPGGLVPLPPAPAPAWVLPAFGLALLFIVSNLALQYGAARLPAQTTAVVMPTEIVFASVSAVLLGAGALTPRLLLGGGLIAAAALVAARGGAGPSGGH